MNAIVSEIQRAAAPARTRMGMPSWLAEMETATGRVVNWHEKRKRVIVNWDDVEASIDRLSEYNEKRRLASLNRTPTERKFAKLEQAKAIVKQLCELLDVPVDMMCGPYRTADCVRMRHIAMWIIRKRLDLSYPFIGKALGDRDHATVIHGIGKVDRSKKMTLEAESLMAKLNRKQRA